ncbi:MAG: hypothetical protein FD169_1851 [Bacillota bacterium]|nr:MAG: hypothetical protein FD169_1851 [Bacillota bacterium]
MEKLIQECDVLINSLRPLPFDKALPVMQKGLWEIADKYGLTGAEVFQRYMDWKYAQQKR